jgi:hypothetical protein
MQFSLKILFLVITVAALSCWGYWVARPRWQMHRDQMQFEEAVKRLKSSGLMYDMWGTIGRHERGIRGLSYDAKGNPVGWIQYDWSNAVYLIYCPLQLRAGGNPDYDLCLSVEVFRLPPTPRGYMPGTPRGRQALPDHAYAYTRDFFEFIAGSRANNPGFKYELIHADPVTRAD